MITNKMMEFQINIQNVTDNRLEFSENELNIWAQTILKGENTKGELTIRFVNIDEIHALNKNYRHKDSPTNVLAFPVNNIPAGVTLDIPLLGDVIICPKVLQKEYSLLDTTYQNHFAHITIHGILHLLGYDHINETDALEMEKKETQYLTELHFSDPYSRGK